MNTNRVQRLEQLLQRSIPFLFRVANPDLLKFDDNTKERSIELMKDIIEEIPRLGGTHIDGKVY